MIADELRRQADLFIDLADMSQHIRRRNGAHQSAGRSAPVSDRTPEMTTVAKTVEITAATYSNRNALSSAASPA